MAKIDIEIDFKPDVDNYAIDTVASLLKSRIMQLFEQHQDYKNWVNTDFKMTVINDKSVTEQLPLFR